MACDEWQELLKRYSAIVNAFSEAVNQSLSLSGEEFERARQRFERLRTDGHTARIDLENHERVHGCSGRAK